MFDVLSHIIHLVVIAALNLIGVSLDERGDAPEEQAQSGDLAGVAWTVDETASCSAWTLGGETPASLDLPRLLRAGRFSS